MSNFSKNNSCEELNLKLNFTNIKKLKKIFLNLLQNHIISFSADPAQVSQVYCSRLFQQIHFCNLQCSFEKVEKYVHSVRNANIGASWGCPCKHSFLPTCATCLPIILTLGREPHVKYLSVTFSKNSTCLSSTSIHKLKTQLSYSKVFFILV